MQGYACLERKPSTKYGYHRVLEMPQIKRGFLITSLRDRAQFSTERQWTSFLRSRTRRSSHEMNDFSLRIHGFFTYGS